MLYQVIGRAKKRAFRFLGRLCSGKAGLKLADS